MQALNFFLFFFLAPHDLFFSCITSKWWIDLGGKMWVGLGITAKGHLQMTALPQELCIFFLQYFLLSKMMSIRSVIMHQATWEASLSHHHPPITFITCVIHFIFCSFTLRRRTLIWPKYPTYLPNHFYCATAGGGGSMLFENWFPGLVLGNVRKCSLSLDNPVSFIRWLFIECFNWK